jgi:hypothetical protein
METTPKLSSARRMRQSLAFGRNLIVLAAIVLLPGVWAAARGAVTLRWPRAEATIIDADLRLMTMPSMRGRKPPDQWNTFHVHYRYNVGGRDFLGGRVEPYDLGMQNSAGAKRMKERHPVGSTAKVAYDPENPAIAYLEPGPSSFSLMLLGIGAIIGGAGLWVRSLARRGIGGMQT